MEKEVLDRIVREKERRKITGRSTASWYRDEKAGKAPRRISIGDNAVGWRLSELMSWLDSRQAVASQVPASEPQPGRKPETAGKEV